MDVLVNRKNVDLVLEVRAMDVIVNRENVDLVLTLLGAQPDGRPELVAAILGAFPGQLIQQSEQLTARELEEALIAAAEGRPNTHPRLHLAEIRAERQALAAIADRLATAGTWVERAAARAFRLIPWAHDAGGRVCLHFALLGGDMTDGAAAFDWRTGEGCVFLELYHLRTEKDLEIVCGHELNHAAVYRRFGPEVESEAGSLLRTLLWRVYLEGLARYSTLHRRFREDREVCFDALQKAIDGVGAGEAWNLHSELFTGSGGSGHLGSTAGVFMFEALETHLSQDRLVEVIGAGVDGVIEEYQRVAAREGLPILRLPA
jgi:hypothetical protein